MIQFRYIGTLIVIMALLMFSVSSPGYAASIEPVRVFVNGFQVLFTQLPVVEEGGTLVHCAQSMRSLILRSNGMNRHRRSRELRMNC